MALRLISAEIPTIRSLQLPLILENIAELPRGLVLVTGATGSGKSTTLAAMLRHINDNKSMNIITIEDPVEFLHTSNRSIIRQREVGLDTASFSAALRSSLRQDPDVILVGEMRDPETMELAITAAETGHLVLATVHTRTAAASVDRIIDTFPGDKQTQIRIQLAGSLEAVISQTLVNKPNEGRIAAMEVLRANPAVSSLIREGKTHQLTNSIVMGSNEGMLSFENSLIHLMESSLITKAEAFRAARDQELLQRLLQRKGAASGIQEAKISTSSRDGGKMR